MCVDDALHDSPCHLAVHMHMSFVLCPGGGVTSCLDPPAIDLASCHWVAICLHGSYSQGNSATTTRFTFYLTIDHHSFEALHSKTTKGDFKVQSRQQGYISTNLLIFQVQKFFFIRVCLDEQHLGSCSELI